MDMPEVQERWPKVEKQLKKRGVEVLAISALSGDKVRQLLYRAVQLLAQAKTSAPEPVEELPVYRPEADPRQFTILRISEGWRVAGQSIELRQGDDLLGI
jgi:GTP-binding protein